MASYRRARPLGLYKPLQSATDGSTARKIEQEAKKVRRQVALEAAAAKRLTLADAEAAKQARLKATLDRSEERRLMFLAAQDELAYQSAGRAERLRKLRARGKRPGRDPT